MTFIKEKDKSSIPTPALFMLMGLFVAVVGYETCNESIDEGHLTSKEITIKKGPKYINGTKKTPAHYRIYANEYLSPFMVSGKGLSIVEDNENLFRSFKGKKVNDTLKVIFLTSRQNSLDNPIEPVEVYGLSDQQQEYFSAGMISSATSRRAKILLLCSAALLITGLVLKLRGATASPDASGVDQASKTNPDTPTT